MIGSIILLNSLLIFASAQRKFPLSFPDYCPYFPKDDGIHCSQMCVPFHLGDPYNPGACYTIAVQETDSTHVQVLVTNLGGTPYDVNALCNTHRVIEMAVQAIDGDGYPIGQWEAAVGLDGLDLFRPHCNIDDAFAWIKIYLPFGYVNGSAPPPPADLPTVSAEKCHESLSLRRRLNNISTTFGFSKDVPTFVRFRQDPARAPGFPGLGLLWRHDYNVPFNVTFIAEVLYDYIFEIKPNPPSMLRGLESTIGRTFYEYNPPLPGLPTPPKKKCFDGSAASTTVYAPKFVDETFQRPLQVSRDYLDELSSSNALGAFTTTAATTTTTTVSTTTTTGPSTTTTTGPSTTTPVPTPKPFVARTTKRPTPPSPVIKGKNTPPTFVGPPPAQVTPSPAAMLSRKAIFDQCRLTKRCLAGSVIGENGRQGPVPGRLREKDDCIKNENCLVMLTYGGSPEGLEIEDNYVYIEMAGKTGSWVAMGLSKNNTKMGNDFVIECVRHRSNENVTIHTSWNVGRLQNPPSFQPTNERFDSTYDKEKFAILHDSGIVEEYVFCKFSLKKILFYNDVREKNGTRITFNLVTTLDFIIMAFGSTNDDASKNLIKHKSYEAWVTDFKVGLGARFSPSPKQQRLIHGHGQIMYFVFMFIFPISLFISRYYKETFIKRRVFGMKDWHSVHTFLQAFGLVTVFGGHFLLSFGNDGWASPKSAGTSSHLGISLTTGTMYFFNAFLGCVDQERAFGSPCDFCHWLHAVLGHVTYIFALATLVGADMVQYSDLSCAARGLVIAWIVIYVCFNVFMSYHYCWIDWVSGTGGRAYAVGPLDLLVQPASVEVAPGKQIRIYILIAFVVTSGGFTIALVTLAGTADKKSACYQGEYFIDQT